MGGRWEGAVAWTRPAVMEKDHISDMDLKAEWMGISDGLGRDVEGKGRKAYS